jgi:hypothetical protein
MVGARLKAAFAGKPAPTMICVATQILSQTQTPVGAGLLAKASSWSVHIEKLTDLFIVFCHEIDQSLFGSFWLLENPTPHLWHRIFYGCRPQPTAPV